MIIRIISKIAHSIELCPECDDDDLCYFHDVLVEGYEVG